MKIELQKIVEILRKHVTNGNLIQSNFNPVATEIEQALQPPHQEEKKHFPYMCVVCGEVPVDVDDGYDTCEACAKRI